MVGHAGVVVAEGQGARRSGTESWVGSPVEGSALGSETVFLEGLASLACAIRLVKVADIAGLVDCHRYKVVSHVQREGLQRWEPDPSESTKVRVRRLGFDSTPRALTAFRSLWVGHASVSEVPLWSHSEAWGRSQRT